MVEAIAYEGLGFRLEALPAGHVLQALPLSLGADIEARLRAIAEPTPFALRRAGPQAWFIVGEGRLRAGEIARRGGEIAEVAFLVDQTDGRRRIVVAGPQSLARLARGIGADLALPAFAIGAAMETQYDGVGLHLTRIGPDRFEILAPSSFAAGLWDELAA